MEAELASARPLALLPHPVRVPEDPIDRAPVDGEPGAAVHPRPPCSRCSDGHGSIRPPRSELLQRYEIEVSLVVDTEVEVGVWAMRAASTTPAQRHRSHSRDGTEVVRKVVEAVVVEHIAESIAPSVPGCAEFSA